MITSDYIVRNKTNNTVWEFKYCLNGHLISFNVLGKPLERNQMVFLFSSKFPATEKIMQDVWMAQTKSVFEIEKGEFDYSFEAWYGFYANKVGKLKQSKNAFAKLSKGDIVLLWKGTQRYKTHMKYNPNKEVQYPATFINQESYLNEWKV